MAIFRRRSKALLAAAAPGTAAKTSDHEAMQTGGWPAGAWAMYDALGEYRQGVTWLSNVLSRVRLVPALAPLHPSDEPSVIDPDSGDPAVDLVQSIGGGIGGQAELLRSGAVHLTVPGEGLLVGELAEQEGMDALAAQQASWRFYSKDCIRDKPGQRQVSAEDRVKQIKVGEGERDWRDLPEESMVTRVWRPHDHYPWRATSSAEAALPIMRRVELLNRKIDAVIQSRLASNGLLWVPSEMDFPTKEGYEEADDPFTADFYDTYSLAISTPGSAAAALPGIIRAKADLIAQVRRDVFADLADPALMAQREAEIRRLATAIDVPPEVLLGMVGINHWGQWQIEESALKTTVTSLLELICWGLTTNYLWPALGAARDAEDAAAIDWDAKRIVWYDLSELTVRPDRSQDAIKLHDSLTITSEATMRETGLDSTDLLTDPDELRFRVGLKAVQQATTFAAGLELLGIEVSAEALASAMGDAGAAAVPSGDDDEPSGNVGDLPANDDVRSTPDTEGDQPSEPPPPPAG